jgi:hypothetical protein
MRHTNSNRISDGTCEVDTDLSRHTELLEGLADDPSDIWPGWR